MTTLLDRRSLQRCVLISTAIFAMVWAVIRANIQSVTIDEAFTYLYFVAKPLHVVFEANSNNHVLNSLLMWLTTRAFGLSNLTLRAPALLGGALYILTCYFFCSKVSDRFSLRLALFVCLTYNPFIFDYMVAARGYSLANAFLVAAIAVPVWHRSRPAHRAPALGTSCVLASLALGLSFTANFAFAFVDAAAWLAIIIWAMRQRQNESIVSIFGFCVLPGLLAVLVIAGYPLTHWRPNDLIVGAHSIKEMRRSIVESSFYRLDLRFQGALWYKFADSLKFRLPLYLEILCFCKLVAAGLDGAWLKDARGRLLGRCAAALAVVTALALTASWLAFHFYGLLLPLGRTGIYLVPLCTLLAGAIAAAPARSVISRWLSRGLSIVFVSLAIYFVLSLRLSYFREYEWNADMKDAYSVMARLNHSYGVSDVGIHGMYVTALNYYRELSGKEAFSKFERETPEISPGRSIYVLDGLDWKDFIQEENLAIIYRGNFSQLVVAVRPDGPIPAAMIEP